MRGILTSKEINQLFITSPVPILQAWRVYNFQKIALGSLAVSRYLFEGLKKIYSNQSSVSVKSTLADLYGKAQGRQRLIKRLIELTLVCLCIPLIIYCIIMHGDEL